ncbi:MAG TPA: hypothetical protein EYQ18_23180 [Candidatus Handelsmanbacteria bacterium]|nr:hypothetical protein [Candidatus Handelsmanbacteria bacterium]
MIRQMKWLLLLAIYAGCAGDGSTLGPDGTPAGDEVVDGMDGGEVEFPPTDISLAQISEQIFSKSCASCHGGGAPAANMSLEAESVAAEIIGVTSTQLADLKRVDPGNPEGSYLLKKLRGDSDILKGQMPLDGVLPDEQIEMIREWIAGGAPIE